MFFKLIFCLREIREKNSFTLSEKYNFFLAEKLVHLFFFLLFLGPKHTQKARNYVKLCHIYFLLPECVKYYFLAQELVQIFTISRAYTHTQEARNNVFQTDFLLA